MKKEKNKGACWPLSSDLVCLTEMRICWLAGSVIENPIHDQIQEYYRQGRQKDVLVKAVFQQHLVRLNHHQRQQPPLMPGWQCPC